MVNNNTIIYIGMNKLITLINQKDIDLSETISILNDQLEQLDVNSKNYDQTAITIKDMILELKTNKENSDRTVLLNKCYAIQQLNNLYSLLNQDNNKHRISEAEKIGEINDDNRT